MKLSPIPELLRTSLENISLQIKLLRTLSQNKKWLKEKKYSKNGDIGGIKKILISCIESPSIELIESSVNLLKSVGALDEKELLTPLGFHLAKLPVGNVKLSKMLIYGVIFRCITPILIISSILTGKSIYRSPRDKREEANIIKKKFYISKSDHLTSYKFFKQWKQNYLFYGPNGGKKFARDNFLSHIVLEQIDGIIKQYVNSLKEIQFINNTYSFEKNLIQMDHLLDKNSKSYKLIKSILVAGLYPNIIRVQMPKKKYDKTLTGAEERENDASVIKFFLHKRYNTLNDKNNNNNNWTNGRIFIHPSSCLKKETKFECPWLVYLTKIETHKLQVYDCSMITVYSLLFFGGNIYVDHNYGHIIIDNWCRFIAPGRIAVLIQELKKMMDYLLMKKISLPTLDITKSKIVNSIERLLKSDGLENK